ncbi:Predicted nucleic-acid-binding protein, contains Zn-ribbon domain [Paenibacillaceae bacterium GAS479]|nr:Predicted nucleic-acid-binding protein, contains Zn-ribbon domain [Paenibacillaceae bacterium GAS479]
MSYKNAEIDCPWCGEAVVLDGTICPDCRHEVLPEHLKQQESGDVEDDVDDVDALAAESAEPPDPWTEVENPEAYLLSKFICRGCGGSEASAEEVAMTGTGLSKIMDLQHNHYLFVSCLNCGLVDVYDPDVLLRRASGTTSNILDLFF